MRIYKDFQFEAAHWLPEVPDGHKCKRLHGHSYKVRLTISGPVGDATGWVADFDELKKAFAPLLEKLDHTCLNDFIYNPTSERIAEWIAVQIDLPDLYSVEVQETCTSGCLLIYSEWAAERFEQKKRKRLWFEANRR
jgi:6-pyruvoyltetrahydropterin/6-carboxytetrahydropterin synthase